MHRIELGLLLFLSVLSSSLAAQSAPGPPPQPAVTQSLNVRNLDRGYFGYVDFGGSANADGRVFVLGLSGGYDFNRHFSVVGRFPFYFASLTASSTTPTTTTGSMPGMMTTSSSTTKSTNSTNTGLGNPSFSLRLNYPTDVLNYRTNVTTWLPVVGTSSGFSTGRVLVAWSNRFSRPFGPAIPFGEITIGNTVPDTPTFVLPYTALGFNTRLEGGSRFEFTKMFSAGVSYYQVLPSGQQRAYSRVMPGSESGGTASGASGGMNGMNFFTVSSVATGTNLTRDHGFSTWFDASPARYVTLEIGYARSFGYKLNTVSFGAGVNLGAWARRQRS